MKENGHIYAIGVLGTSSVKIGSTSTPVEKRLTALQIGHPLPLSIIATVMVAERLVDIERYIHRRLQAHHRRGEWFDVPMDAEQLQQLVDEALLGPLPATSRMQAPVGERVRRLRRTKDLTQEALAALAHLNVITLSRLENGTAKAVYADTVLALALALGSSTDYLLGLEEEHACDTPAGLKGHNTCPQH